MKKLILITGILFFTLLQTKAQQEKQFVVANYVTALNSTVLPWEKTDSKKLYNTATNGPDKDHDFYLRRSKNYRIVGWSTLGAGILLSGIGLLAANGDYATNDANSNTAATLTIAGAVSGVVSIPFMIMASAYKHKARVMVGNQKTGFGVPSNVSKNITGITMTIPIGK
jgi:hypothetical protein